MWHTKLGFCPHHQREEIKSEKSEKSNGWVFLDLFSTFWCHLLFINYIFSNDKNKYANMDNLENAKIFKDVNDIGIYFSNSGLKLI